MSLLTPACETDHDDLATFSPSKKLWDLQQKGRAELVVKVLWKYFQDLEDLRAK